MSRTKVLPPNYRELDRALRSIGYSFEAAVADIIDNSIDEDAENVLVRLFIRKDGHLDLAIWDDGNGMNGATLEEAMRFGAAVTAEINRLGKFGLGLKLASLSQAKELRVITTKGGELYGMAWLEHGITHGFACTTFDKGECKPLVSAVFPDRPLQKHGTVVRWSHLYRIGQYHGDAEEHAQKLRDRLKSFLEIAFHRFLSGSARKVAISLDIFDQGSASPGIPTILEPLDPFNYGKSIQAGFPAEMLLAGNYHNRIKMKAHVWPPNAVIPEYRLPGGSNSRQGFYFYRQNRLIQGGGWNGMRETEPHTSLARVEIDLDPDMDVDISLDIKKVEIQLPPGLVTAIQNAKTASGVSFKQYLTIAQNAYRKRKPAESDLPLIPSQGLPSDLTSFLHKQLRLKATAKHRDLKFQWKKLGKSLFFYIERDTGQLFLNSIYRKQLLHGLRSSSTDIPVIKCLLFLVLEDTLSSERMSPQSRQEVEKVNRILVKAVKYERLPE